MFGGRKGSEGGSFFSPFNLWVEVATTHTRSRGLREKEASVNQDLSRFASSSAIHEINGRGRFCNVERKLFYGSLSLSLLCVRVCSSYVILIHLFSYIIVSGFLKIILKGEMRKGQKGSQGLSQLDCERDDSVTSSESSVASPQSSNLTQRKAFNPLFWLYVLSPPPIFCSPCIGLFYSLSN